MNATTPDPRLVEAAKKAIAVAGGGAALARECLVTRFAVQQWKGTGIPPKHVGRVAAFTNVPPHELRPDLFPAPQPSTHPEIAA